MFCQNVAIDDVASRVPQPIQAMTIWLLALAITAISSATLYYAAAGRAVNAASTMEAEASHFRAQLQAIETDLASERIGAGEAESARGEIAREWLRVKGEGEKPAGGLGGRWMVAAVIVAAAGLALGTYAYLGRPDLPAEPLSTRGATNEEVDLATAIKTIEARLKDNPDDLRGWQVIAPAYMQLGRYADAVKALRRVNALAVPTAETETDLGEALMMLNGGKVEGEALDLFRKAAALDPAHVRSRYYIAGAETTAGDYQAAVRDWTALLKLAKGDEPWVATARNGLAFAQAGLNPTSAQPQLPDSGQVAAMVDGLEARLKSEGGSLEDWTKLVRSRLVQGRPADAQAAYDAARKAYPDASARTELDALAKGAGLGGAP